MTFLMLGFLSVLLVRFGAYGHLHDKLSSSKTEFTCIFYDVFDVGFFAGSSFIEVSHLYTFGICLLPLLTITNKLEFAQFGAHL